MIDQEQQQQPICWNLLRVYEKEVSIKIWSTGACRVVHINRRGKKWNQRPVVLSEIKYPYLIPEGASIGIPLEQIASYKIHGIDEEVCDKDRVDESWSSIGALTDDHDRDVKLYIQLSKVMLGILTIPHSSAHCERLLRDWDYL